MTVFKNVFAGILLGVFSVATADAATLVNGSLTGPIANGVFAPDGVPSGWQTLAGNPDTIDENNNVGITSVPFQTAPSGASPDGGTWVGLGQDDPFVEIFGQTINDFAIGTTYELSWYAGNFGADLSGLGSECFCETNGIFAALDGTIIGMGADLTSDSEWVQQSLQFTASSTSHLLSFGLTGAGPSYMSIDGISLTEVAAIPVPAGGVLLVSGVAGLAALRRRRARR